VTEVTFQPKLRDKSHVPTIYVTKVTFPSKLRDKSHVPT